MNQIIYIISPPRARSTIFFRALQAQLDKFICYHEPSQNLYNNEKETDYTADWYKNTAFKSYENIRASIIQSSLTNPVLVKEISTGCYNCLTDDFISATNGLNIYFIFLIRHPLETITSLYKQSYKNMDKFFIEYIGYERLYELYNRISNLSLNKPLIINGLNDSYQAIESVLSYAKLDIPVKLQWNSLGCDFNGDIWHEQKKIEHMRYWHNDAINSTHIQSELVNQSPIKKLDDLINVVESINPSHKEQVIEAYNHNLFFYKQIINKNL